MHNLPTQVDLANNDKDFPFILAQPEQNGNPSPFPGFLNHDKNSSPVILGSAEAILRSVGYHGNGPFDVLDSYKSRFLRGVK